MALSSTILILMYPVAIQMIRDGHPCADALVEQCQSETATLSEVRGTVPSDHNETCPRQELFQGCIVCILISKKLHILCRSIRTSRQLTAVSCIYTWKMPPAALFQPFASRVLPFLFDSETRRIDESKVQLRNPPLMPNHFRIFGRRGMGIG